jgi:GT2 family glycosyltransferase
VTDSQFRQFWNRQRNALRANPVIQWFRRIEQNLRRKRKLRQAKKSNQSYQGQKFALWKIFGSTQDAAKRSLEHFALLSLQTFLSSNSRLRFPAQDVPEVSVVLVLYNRCELTLLCLQSLLTCSDVQLEVIIVDNQSTDSTSSFLECVDGVKVVRNSENVGYVKAVNQGAKLATGRYLLLLNNDTELTPNAIAFARETLQEDAQVGAVGGRLVLSDGTLQEAGATVFSDGTTAGFRRGRNLEDVQCMFRRCVDYCSAAFLLLRTEEFHSLNGFDEQFSPGYYEEVDFCTRMIQQGLKVVYDPRVVVRHFEFASSALRSDAEQLMLDDRLLYLEKHREWIQHQPSARTDEIIPHRSRMSGKKRVLYIDDEVPFPHLGAGLPRASRVLKVLSESEYELSFYSMRLVFYPWSEIYQTYGTSVECVQNQGVLRLSEFLEQRVGYFDLMIVSRPHNMEEVASFLKDHPDFLHGTKLIYDAEAVVSFREIERRRLEGESISEEQRQQLVDQELELVKSADLIWAVSPNEAEHLSVSGKNALVLSHAEETTPDPDGFETREGYLFVGAVRSIPSPNSDSLEWFFNDVYPCLIEQSAAIPPIRIAGNMVEKMLDECHKFPCDLLGFVEDLSPHYWQAKVFIAPTRYAAGIALKILEAASHGVPIVATPILAKQLSWTNESELLVAESATEFAAACIRLHNEQELWERLQTNALNAIKRDYSVQKFSQTIHESLGMLLNNS